MIKKHLFSLLHICIFHLGVTAQNTIETILTSIKQNNKTLQASYQYWESQALRYKTGLTLANPNVSYDYMIGSPILAGNQTDISIAQSFDFPSVYAKRSQLSVQKMAQIDFQLAVVRQEILLEAKKVCIELVYRNKLQSELHRRKNNFGQLLEKFQIQLSKGEGSIMDVNKAQLQLIEINKKIQFNNSEIQQKKQQLTALNGGNTVEFNDTTYSLSVAFPSFEELEAEIERKDPIRKILEQQKNIAEQQVELSRSLALPKFELGYHYQGILGQRYQGAHLGLTIPLWENKNAVKAAVAENLFTDLNLQDHKNEHYFEIKQLYEKYTHLNTTLLEYQTVFTEFNHSLLLEKSLKLGKITALEYFMEVSYYYISYDGFLETEYQSQLVLAELTKYEL
jgi:outer membrane protein, heavy metal efflux system